MVAVAQKAHPVWLYEDLRHFPPDRQRYEIVEGDLHVSPAPRTQHQRLSKWLEIELYHQIEEKGLGEVFDAPLDVIFSPTSVVQPDLLVVRQERRFIISQRGIEAAPDLLVEILSPSNADFDRNIKKKLYAAQGVPEYWIVDAEASCIEVYALAGDRYAEPMIFRAGDRLRSQVFVVDIEVARLFAER